MSVNRVFVSKDASCGYFSLLPNILRTFGWNPGHKIFNWLGSKFREKTGDADVTFQQVSEPDATFYLETKGGGDVELHVLGCLLTY